MKGKFIVFEGIDGSGKTIQAQLLFEYLKKRGFDVILTREPTDGPIGKLIRSALKKKWKAANVTLQLLFSADRSHHLATEIIPSVEEGKIVISDRYAFSTIAYGSLDIDEKWLEEINSKFIQPDVIFILDLPVDIAIDRIKSNRSVIELFEEKEKLEKIRKTYLTLAEKYPNCYVIDATKSVEEIHSEIKEVVEKILF